MTTSTKNKISIIGLGKLGSSYAAVLAENGFQVLGYDTDPEKTEKLKNGRAPVQETDLDKYIRNNKDKLDSTNTIKDLFTYSDTTLIIVPTPSKKDGSFSTKFIEEVAKNIGPALSQKKRHHLFVLVSTITPGDSRKNIISSIEKYSGKVCGADFGYCYSPSLIALGNIIRNLEKPDFLFVGAFDKRSSDSLSRIYRKIYKDKVPIRKMGIESAEIAKIALNSYVTMKITFANILGEICEKVPYADTDEVTEALGSDKRIGHAYLKSGLGYGGPCFPRDNKAFAYMAKSWDGRPDIANATHTLNEKLTKSMSRHLESYLDSTHKKIGFLGVSYKPDTSITEESHAVKIIKHINNSSKKPKVGIYDPSGYNNAKPIFNNSVYYSSNLADIVEFSQIIFVSNYDKKFKKLPKYIREMENPKKMIIIDPWGMFTLTQFPDHITYRSLGRKNKQQK